MTSLKIALMGAPGSGVSQLADLLTRELARTTAGASVAVVESVTADTDLASFDLVFLMGLGGPVAVDGEPDRSGFPDIHAQQRADTAMRAALLCRQIPFRVVYGDDQQRLAQALQVAEGIRPTSAQPLAQASRGGSNGTWVWSCEKCSDPACEHKLLTDLLAQREGTASTVALRLKV